MSVWWRTIINHLQNMSEVKYITACITLIIGIRICFEMLQSTFNWCVIGIFAILYIVYRKTKQWYSKHKRIKRMKQIIKNGTINVRIMINNMNRTFYVKTQYSSNINIKYAIDEAVNQLNKIKFSTSYGFDKLIAINKDILHSDKRLTDSITNYGEELERIGITFLVKIQYRHKIANVDITCKYLTRIHRKDRNVMDCPVYRAMIIDNIYTEYNFDHLCNFVHFRNAYQEQASCHGNYNCESFIRFQNKSNSLSDRCHNKLYRHPPRRNRQIQMAENCAFVINENANDNKNSYQPRPESSVEK
eukprot:301776_1